MTTDFSPLPGQPLTLEPGLRLVLAPNPSPMTERGTNTYLLGEGAVTVIDPGPADPVHLAAILAALAPGERIVQILVTHAHKDHSPLARPLAEASGAPVLAFGDALVIARAFVEAAVNGKAAKRRAEAIVAQAITPAGPARILELPLGMPFRAAVENAGADHLLFVVHPGARTGR